MLDCPTDAHKLDREHALFFVAKRMHRSTATYADSSIPIPTVCFCCGRHYIVSHLWHASSIVYCMHSVSVLTSTM